jgi:hypothetical protein
MRPFLISLSLVLGVLTVGCRDLQLRDGFMCSSAGNCPAPYRCQGGKCYRNPTDAGDAPSSSPDGRDVVIGGPDGGPDGATDAPPNSLAEGQPCSDNAACQSTFCRDGVCCESACSGRCQACAEALSGQPNGKCGMARAGMDPHTDCEEGRPEDCGDDGFCDGAGACRRYGSNQICGMAMCSGSQFVPTRTCNGAGQCAAAQPTDCGAFPCTTTGCAQPCTGDTECGAQSYCASGMCRAKKTSGEACGNMRECVSAQCIDGVCCATACPGTCMACSVALTGQSSGMCQPVPAGQDMENECTRDTVNACGLTGFCNGAGACQITTSGTSCADPRCVDGTFTPASTCNGAGVCVAATPRSCGFACASPTACRTTCTADVECATDRPYCVNGTCQIGRPLGGPCTLGTQCASGNCVDGACCSTASCPSCRACNLNGAGTCSNKGIGAADANCPADPATCQAGGCNGAGGCAPAPANSMCGPYVCTNTATGAGRRNKVCDGTLGAAACKDGANVVCTGNLLCADGTSCLTTCTADSHCASGLFCVAGACTRFREMPLADGGISADGTIVVGGTSRWVVGSASVTALNGVPPTFVARDISADGTTVVGGNTRWTANLVQSIGLPTLDYSFQAWATSANGTMTVGEGSDGGNDFAFTWTMAQGTAFSFAPGSFFENFAYGVSDDGTIGVGRGDSAPIWFTTSAATVLSGTNGVARAISGNGLVIAGFLNVAPIGGARWSGASYATRQFLSGLPAAPTSVTPNAVNYDGSVIVGASGVEAALWTTTGSAQRIADILVTAGVSLTGWTLEAASDVSANGKVVIGSGKLNGVTKSWIARLP